MSVDSFLDLFIKMCYAAIIGCVAYVYVKTVKNPNYHFWLNF